jgi:hypothetical protein
VLAIWYGEFNERLDPKSPSLRWPIFVRKMFLGLISRWRIFFFLHSESVEVSWAKILRMKSSSKGTDCASLFCYKSPPSTNSITM